MVFAVGESWLSDILSWSVLGYILLAIGVVVTFLSSYRYLLFYCVGGMAYWLVVTIIQKGLVGQFSLSHWHGYVAALASTWFISGVWVVSRLSRMTQSNPITPNPERCPHTYIEHTPIYANYKPRFRN